MNAKGRFKNLCIAVFGITFSWTILAHNHYGHQLQAMFGAYYSYIFAIVSLVSYDLVLTGSIFAIDHVATFKKLYWGKLYLEGLWEYTSRSAEVEFFGIWRIEQDVFGLKVVAFGLDESFGRRSTVRSVSDLLGEGGIFEVINERWDIEEGVRKQFSRTVLVPDIAVPHYLLFRYPDVIRGETVIYGGSSDSVIASNLRMKRRPDCHTEDELITRLKNERLGFVNRERSAAQDSSGIQASGERD